MKILILTVVLLGELYLIRGDMPYGYVDGANCVRNCDLTSQMNCYYNFRLETFYSMSKACYNCPSVRSDCNRMDCIVGGGLRRTVAVVNRQLPGPSIEVCEGDRVMVFVENMFETGEGATIHWHGQRMEGTPYMDGVPYITQCPIHYNNNFTYVFTATTPGTHVWHSHVEMQRGDGVFGALIVRQRSRRNPHVNLYQFDLPQHKFVLTDWNDRPRMEVFQAYAKAGAFLEPTGILINGLGPQPNVTRTPMANFVVQRGSTYRFRLINIGFFDCPLELTVDDHKLLVISSDGEDVRPVLVDSILSTSGERFDFILTADRPIATYYIRVKGHLLCERLGTFQLATLQYSGSSSTTPAGPAPTYATANNASGVLLNPMSRVNAVQTVITIDQLRSVNPTPSAIATPYPRRFFLSLDMSGVDHPANHRSPFYGFNQVDPNFRARTPQINHISFKAPSSPLLPYRYVYDRSDFCTAETMASRNCRQNYCECLHVIEANLGEVVELVLFEEADQTDALAIHPFHIHGFGFHVVSWQELGANLTREQVMANYNQYPKNLDRNPPIKDSVNVPRGGVTIVRFWANNPGYWFMHCHIDVHSTEGMELAIKVGSNDQMPDEPFGFPECGNFPDPRFVPYQAANGTNESEVPEVSEGPEASTVPETADSPN